MNLKSLWNYMQVDMEADGFEAKMRQSENRQKLIKSRNFIIEQQGNMKKLEGDLAAMQDRLEAVSDESKRLEGQISAFTAEIEANPPKDKESADVRIEALQRLMDDLTRYERELTKMRKDVDTKDRQQKDIRLRAAKSKQEYDAIKVVYDKEYKDDTDQLARLRAKAEKEAGSVDGKLVSRYREIKQHVSPPMSRIVNGQCGGCFMNLPSAALLALKTGDRIIECDNCGRIIYSEEPLA